MRRLVPVLMLLGCGAPSGAARVDHLAPSAGSVTASAERPPRPANARWVVRISASNRPFGVNVGTALYGPVQNNFGTDQSVYLGGGRAGAIASGRRFVYESGRIKYASPSAPVDAVKARPDGGFVFHGPAGLYVASRFDGELVSIAPPATQLNAVLPGALLLSTGELVSPTTGQRLPGTPLAFGRAYAHPRGFAVVTSDEQPSKAWCTKKGDTWLPLTVPARGPKGSEDGISLGAQDDAIVVTRSKRSYRIDAQCSMRSVTLTDEALFEGQFRVSFEAPLGPSAEHDLYEGALAATYVPLGGSEWLGVVDRQVVVVDAKTRSRQPFGPPLAQDGAMCNAHDRTTVVCATLGLELRTYTVDVTKRTVTAKAAITAAGGFAPNIGARGVYPAALMIQMSCDGKSDGRACVRRSNDTWSSVPLPTAGLFLPFQDDTMSMHENEHRDYVFESERRPARVVPSAEIDRLYAAMRTPRAGPKSAKIAVADAGLLHERDALRFFHVPNPFEPIPSDAASFVWTIPFDPGKAPTVQEAAGVVAIAGTHALRLGNGQLWETADGWRTWERVEPPPTGVPNDLAGAMCSNAGCEMGPWLRVGWNAD